MKGDGSVMEAWQQRVIDEKKQLDERIEKLAIFIQGELYNTLDPVEQKRLTDQIHAMDSYARILGQRIGAWPWPVEIEVIK
jgi:hypothetical protein